MQVRMSSPTGEAKGNNMLRSILQLNDNDSVLRKKSRKLTLDEIKSDEIQLLIQEMKKMMREAPGVGLAAPQIGINIQLAVIEDPMDRLIEFSPQVLSDKGREHVPFHVIINPDIINLSGKLKYFFEGCLSVKGHVRVTPRHDSVKIDFLDEYGQKKIIDAKGWYARILQHEIDHLNGRLYVDIADERTDLIVDDNFKKKWAHALSPDILDFFKAKCSE